jgi:hypothetical protein
MDHIAIVNGNLCTRPLTLINLPEPSIVQSASNHGGEFDQDYGDTNSYVRVKEAVSKEGKATI